MASIKYSALVTGMRGKLNGSVLSTNRGGDYVRNKTTPVNPSSGYQSLRRAIFGSIASAWRSLTENEAKTWVAVSEKYPYINIWGDTKHLTGIQLHQQLNTNRSILGLAPLTLAPLPQSVAGVAGLAVVADESDDSMKVTAQLEGTYTGSSLVIYASAPQIQSKFFSKNIVRLIAVKPAAETVIDITAEYKARFGDFKEGDKIFIGAFIIAPQSGQAGVMNTVSTLVVA